MVELRRALRLVWQSGRGWTIASTTILVTQAILALLSLYLLKIIVDAVATATADRTVSFTHVALSIGLVAVVALLSGLCRSVASCVSEGQAQAVTDHVNDLLHAKAVAVDLEYYENSDYHDTLQRAMQDASFRPTRILHGLIQIAQSAVALLLMAGLLFSLDWRLAAVLFAAAVPGVFLRTRYAGRLYRWQRQHTTAERRAWYFHWILTGIVHAKEVRLFDLGPLFRRGFREIRENLRRGRFALTVQRSAAELVGHASLVVTVFGVYVFVAYRAVHGGLTIGDLVMYYQAFQRGQEFLREMLSGLAGLYEDRLFLRGLYDFLDLDHKVLEPTAVKSISRPIRAGIEFKQVSFRYPTGTREVLQNLTLTIRPGESVALVGENGSGKTTLIKLLCRLYEPTDGAITIDGIDIRELETAALRREMGVIFQDYAQYQLTARENIWLGNVDLARDDPRIVNAARHSGADGVIERLPRGYDTVLGKWLEQGEELSIGEWQKVALARAFLRDAQIMVLDEPTSALDAKAECEVFEQFRRLAEGRTTILISHRLSTVKMVDRIYVLEDGRIVEGGTHEELMRAGGRYERLFEAQARQYR